MLLVANLDNIKLCKKPEKRLKPWHMGTHLRELCESYPMHTNMTGFRLFSKILCFLVLWMKIASALDGLTHLCLQFSLEFFLKRCGLNNDYTKYLMEFSCLIRITFLFQMFPISTFDCKISSKLSSCF